MAITRNPWASYVIPTENEWYKAAFYKGGGTNAGYWTYQTQSNTAPSNAMNSAGTNNANYEPGFSYTDPTNLKTPVGYFAASPGPYGTFDMAGDNYQWNEAILINSSGVAVTRGIRGGQLGRFRRQHVELVCPELPDPGRRRRINHVPRGPGHAELSARRRQQRRQGGHQRPDHRADQLRSDRGELGPRRRQWGWRRWTSTT